MANKKKRTGLDALGLGAAKSETVVDFEEKKAAPVAEKPAKAKASGKGEIAKTTVYVPLPVYEQWRELAFTERKKMHDYLIEGLDRVFQNRGLKSIEELTGE
jgi:hypothetical protein